MTRIRRPAPRQSLPHDLVLLITRKADIMVRQFEDQVLNQLVRDALRALERGATVEEIARDLGLGPAVHATAGGQHERP